MEIDVTIRTKTSRQQHRNNKDRGPILDLYQHMDVRSGKLLKRTRRKYSWKRFQNIWTITEYRWINMT